MRKGENWRPIIPGPELSIYEVIKSTMHDILVSDICRMATLKTEILRSPWSCPIRKVAPLREVIVLAIFVGVFLIYNPVLGQSSPESRNEIFYQL